MRLPKTDDNQISERQRDLWDALNEFIRKDGGAIVSVKYASPVSIEVPIGPELSEKLRELGYDLILPGTRKRTSAGVSFIAIQRLVPSRLVLPTTLCTSG